MMSKPNEKREACAARPPAPKPCETQDSLVLRHLLSIILHFLFIFPPQPRGTGRLWMLTLDGRLKGIAPPPRHSTSSPPHRRETASVCFHVLFSSIDHRTHYVCRGPVCQRSGLMPAVQNGEKEKKKKKNPRGIKICFASHSLKKRNWPNHRKSGLLGLDQKKSS